MMLWAFVGTLYLILLLYDDYKHKMMVDDRKNFFMMGMTISLIMIYPRPYWYFLSILGIVLLFGFVMHKMKSLGSADIKSLMWIIYGFAIIALNSLIIFTIAFVILFLLFEFMKKVIFKTNKPFPFYGVLLIAFVFSCGILQLYL